MVQIISRLADIAVNYGAIVFDQWGVLQDETQPYEAAVATLRSLQDQGHRLGVLSNSGKRAQPNIERISKCLIQNSTHDYNALQFYA